MSNLINRDNAQKIFYSSNEFSLLNSNIRTFFGEKYTFYNTLKRYENFKEFDSHIPIRNVNDILEITNSDIFELIENEKYYLDKAKRLFNEYQQYNTYEDIPTDRIIYFAQELGLYPKECLAGINVLSDWKYKELAGYRNYNYDSLYPDLMLFHLMDKSDLEEYKQKFHDNIENKTILFDYLFDYIDDKFLHYLIDGRLCLEFGYSRYFFRGENAYYGSSKAGLFRRDGIENIDLIISIIKMLELYNLYNMLNVNQYGIDIYGSAFAQHYSLPTHCLDFTTDLKVALFFACCKYDHKQKKYFPLTKEDFRYKDSRKHIAEKGGDSRFAIIFRVPSDFIRMSNSIPDGPYKHIHSIGYQPFLRSEMQKGYIVETSKDYNLYKDWSFEKFKFRLNEEICNWIYNEMNGGDKLFPEEVFTEIDDIIEDINRLEVYSESSLIYIISKYNNILNNISIDELKKQLLAKGHVCVQDKKWCDGERLQELQNKYKNKFNFEKFLNYRYRKMFAF